MRSHLQHVARCRRASGFTMLEVVIAIFIFGCVAASLFGMMIQTDRIQGRALYLENCMRLAADEAERLRSNAARNAIFEDSMYTVASGERIFTIRRIVLKDDAPPSFIPKAREPVAVTIEVDDENDTRFDPIQFKLLVGQESP